MTVNTCSDPHWHLAGADIGEHPPSGWKNIMGRHIISKKMFYAPGQNNGVPLSPPKKNPDYAHGVVMTAFRLRHVLSMVNNSYKHDSYLSVVLTGNCHACSCY